MSTSTEKLAPFAEAIRATSRPIIAARVGAREPPDLLGSRLGGRPWWPARRPWPVDRAGAPLLLLAQINFAEAPETPAFPRAGLLQVFIGTDDLYGSGLISAADTGFACVFHHELDATPLETWSFLNFDPARQMSPLEEPLRPRALELFADAMPVDPTDYRFDRLLPEIASDEDLSEAYFDMARAPAIRLGGYPTFTQQDPRSGHGEEIGNFSLLTIDTTDGVMWGDSGVTQFLMHEDDLARGDFSRVRYNWDCC